MPLEEVKTLQITCDNSACPGNELDAADRTGWLFINSEVYGQPSQQNVYCCAECSAVAATSTSTEGSKTR